MRYRLTFHLREQLVDDDFDRLFEAGFDDATLGNEAGHGFATVMCEDQARAVRAAQIIPKLEREGFHVENTTDETW